MLWRHFPAEGRVVFNDLLVKSLELLKLQSKAISMLQFSSQITADWGKKPTLRITRKMSSLILRVEPGNRCIQEKALSHHSTASPQLFQNLEQGPQRNINKNCVVYLVFAVWLLSLLGVVSSGFAL